MKRIIGLFRYGCTRCCAGLLFFGLAWGGVGYAQSDSLLRRAVEWRQSGNVAYAVTLLNELTASGSKNEAALYELAYTHLMLENYTLALENANRVTQLKGNWFLEARLVAAICYKEKLQWEKSLRILNELAKKLPSDERIPYQYADLMLRTGQLEKAETHVQKAIVMQRGFTDAHLLLASILIEKGDRLKALLPLYYLLLLENTGPQAQTALEQLAILWQKRNNNVQIKGKGGNADPFYARLSAQMNRIAHNDSIAQEQGSAFVTRMQHLTRQLFEVFPDEEPPFDFYHLWYVGFFEELHNAGHLEAFVWFISDSKAHAEVLEWIAGHAVSFDAFRLWMTLR